MESGFRFDNLDFRKIDFAQTMFMGLAGTG
jgi:hypothetical protein